MCILIFDSATDESETNSPFKMTHQESNEEMVYLSRIQKGTRRSKMVIDKINDMKMKLGSKVTLRKKLESQRWTLNLQRKLAIQLNVSELKMTVIWVRAMTGCLARSKQVAWHADRCSDGATHPHGRIKISQPKNQEE